MHLDLAVLPQLFGPRKLPREHEDEEARDEEEEAEDDEAEPPSSDELGVIGRYGGSAVGGG